MLPRVVVPFFCLALLAAASLLAVAPLHVPVSAQSAVLMNARTGVLLFAKQPHQPLYPASITKIATAAYILEVKRPQDLDLLITAEQDCIGSVTEEAKQRSGYKLPAYWLVTDCSHMGIKKGEQMSVRALLSGMMIVSADDASNVLAHAFGGSVPQFMEEVNLYLKETGCTQTYFNNPHGLHHPEHVTTAYDMALLARRAMQNPLFREIVATTRYQRPKTNKQEPTMLVQTNRLLRPGELYYPKAIGIKTGWHSKAGHTLVAAAQEGDRLLIAVLLNAKDRKEIFKEARALFEAAFSQPKVERLLVRAGDQKYQRQLEGVDQPLKTYVKREVAMAFYPAEEPKIAAKIVWQVTAPPVEKDAQVATLFLTSEDGAFSERVELYAKERIEAASWAAALVPISWYYWILGGVAFIGLFFGVKRLVKS